MPDLEPVTEDKHACINCRAGCTADISERKRQNLHVWVQAFEGKVSRGDSPDAKEYMCYSKDCGLCGCVSPVPRGPKGAS